MSSIPSRTADRARLAAAILAASLSTLFATAAPAVPMVSYSIVADSSTPVPGQGGPSFISFGAPSINNGNIAFSGAYRRSSDNALLSGIYKDVGGGLSVVADDTINNPGPFGPTNRPISLQFREPVSIDANGGVAFRGAVGGTSAIFSDAGGSLTQAAARDQASPTGGSDILLNFSSAHIDDGKVSWRGNSGLSGTQGTTGIFRDTGSALERIVALGDPVPGGTTNLSNLGNPITENGITVFTGNGPSPDFEGGIFSTAGGALAPLVSRGDDLPGGASTFFQISSVAPDRNGTDVVFAAIDDTFTTGGIYALIGGSLTTLIDSTTLLPGTTTGQMFNPLSFNQIAYDNGNLLFISSSTLYGLFDDTLIDLSASLAGLFPGLNQVSMFQLDQALSGNEFAVTVSGSGSNGQFSTVVRGTISDGTSGPTPLPAPSTSALLVSALVLLHRRSRKQRRAAVNTPPRDG